MGATDMFSEAEARFSGFRQENETNASALFVSDFNHKAYIEMDEGGAEAAAPTGD